jgi:uncharacterized ParB-like nuclease family protein
MDHLFEDPKYYTKLDKIGLENIKVKIYPGGLGADVDYDKEEFKQLPTKTISLDQLTLNEPAEKMKQPTSKATLKQLIKSIKAGEEVPPIIVRKLGDKYQVIDGHHRYFAFKALGKDSIKAVVVDPEDVEILKEFEEIPDVEAVETVDVSKGFIDYNPQNLNVGEEIYYSFDGKSYHKGKVVNRPSSAKPNVYTIKNTNGIPTVIIYGGDRTNVRLKKKSLNENQLNQDLIKEFLKACMLELGIIKLPKITLSNNSQEAIDMRSWGGYMPGKKSIHIVIAKRHPADIFRTLAHELVHYKQDLDGRLKPGSGKTGSKDENEANSKAAVIMRNFAQAKPNLFEHLNKN